MLQWFFILPILFIFFAKGNASTITDLNYSLKDLEILELQENYEEFFEHAKDIRPSERSAIWKEMAQNMAQGLVFSKSSKKDFKQSTYLKIEELAEWPEIKDNEIFLVKRANYLTLYFEECVSLKYPYCQQEMIKSWSRSDMPIPAHVELGLAFADILQKKLADVSLENTDQVSTNQAALLKKGETLNPHSLQLFKNAFSDRFGAIYCLRENVQKLALEQLLSMNLKYLNPPEARIKITSVISDNCLNAMANYLHHKLKSSDRKIRETVYLVLNLKHLTRGKEEDAYLVRYLLDGPEVGDTFNEAWNRLEKLGLNFERRQNVLKELLALDYLPDKILNHFDQKKKKVILDRFKNYFPEYFDLYGKNCYGFYSGSMNFDNGNPTINCQKLIELSHLNSYIVPDLAQKIKALPYFKKQSEK